MDFFNTRMCFGKLWEQQMLFSDTKFCLLKFLSKSLHFEEGGGGNGNLERAYILIFFTPFPYGTNVHDLHMFAVFISITNIFILVFCVWSYLYSYSYLQISVQIIEFVFSFAHYWYHQIYLNLYYSKKWDTII